MSANVSIFSCGIIWTLINVYDVILRLWLWCVRCDVVISCRITLI